MEVPSAVAMDDDVLVGLLGRGGTGVLSFATDGGEPPFSLPVAYGFSEATTDFYFRLDPERLSGR